jgi:thiol:disulfide interchange protein/DsbC/DsbD-like thiol-disulfide interchange protein
VIRLFILLLGLLALSPVQAQPRFTPAPLNVPAILEAETAAPAPGGTVTLAFVMKPKPKWHGYWENGGDAGLGMQLEWDLPPGVSAGKLRYPVPGTLMLSGFMNYVYEQPYALLVDLKFDQALPVGTKLPIKVRADWLACDDKACVPEGDDLSVALVIGSGSVTGAERTRFDAYRAALPTPLAQQGRYRIEGQFIEIAIPFPASAALQAPYFFSQTEKVIAYSKPQLARRSGDMLIIKTGLDPFSGKNFGDGAIDGVLKFGDGQGITISATRGEVPSGGTAIITTSPVKSLSVMQLMLALGGAILGGLILNLMPCVFPILGLKALSLAKMGGDERGAKRDALAYSSGVILSMLALGAAMLTLRAAGEQIGWAFQLQEPRVVLGLLLLMVAVTVNLLGGFELAMVNTGHRLTRDSGAVGSFWTGALAAIVATPCTGPFMAAALGAALILPISAALLIFAALGLGLALPYLAVAYIPALRTRLPKSGPWLGTFRRLMAIPMALTALALFWLLWRLSGQFGLVIGGAGAVSVAIMLLFIGNAQRRSGMLPPIMAACLLFLVSFAVMALPRSATKGGADSADLIVVGEPYSEAILAKYRAENRPVFVYFTADWCVTCKINEAIAIQQKSTASAFKKAGVKVLVGDFTRRDPALGRTLAKYGRSGVPLYLYYPKGGQAVILPQILTANILAALPRNMQN